MDGGSGFRKYKRKSMFNNTNGRKLWRAMFSYALYKGEVSRKTKRGNACWVARKDAIREL